MRRAAALLLATALLPGAALAQPAPGAVPLRVRVRGSVEIHALATRAHGELTVRGEVVDDAGAPVGGAALSIAAVSAARGGVRLGSLGPCEGSGGRGARAVGEEAQLEADERGSFCVTGRAPADDLRLRLRYRRDKIRDAAEVEVPVASEEEGRERTLLRLEPPPESLDLDREAITITAALRVERSAPHRVAPAGGAQRAGLVLVLEDERHQHLADATTGGDGRARFELRTAGLAGPGAGELSVRFAGNGALGRAEDTRHVVRRAEVHVALAHPVERADPEDGLPIDVVVTTSRGPVSGGVVEVRRVVASGAAPSIADSLGASTVDEHGRARILATFPSGGSSRAALVARYVPAAPWFRAGPELRFEAELAGPGVLRRVFLALMVVGAALWVASGWRRSPRPRVLPGLEGSVAPPSGKAGVVVVESPPDLVGWRGTVADAHDGTPIVGARIALVVPSFEGDGTSERVTTDERGAFTLEAAYRSDARLVVTAPDHTTHQQQLPPPAVLRIALVTRRRALLERLVRWARQRGAPFDGAPEPTPGHVRRVAARARQADIEAWAGRVERAAYGPERLDEEGERTLRGEEPGAPR